MRRYFYAFMLNKFTIFKKFCNYLASYLHIWNSFCTFADDFEIKKKNRYEKDCIFVSYGTCHGGNEQL